MFSSYQTTLAFNLVIVSKFFFSKSDDQGEPSSEEEESGMTKIEKKLWSCVSAYDALHQLNVIC